MNHHRHGFRTNGIEQHGWRSLLQCHWPPQIWYYARNGERAPEGGGGGFPSAVSSPARSSIWIRCRPFEGHDGRRGASIADDPSAPSDLCSSSRAPTWPACCWFARTPGSVRSPSVQLWVPAEPARQLLTESVILSLFGGAFGLVLGITGIRAILRSYPSNPLLAPLNVIPIPRIGESGSAITLDWRILAFTFLTSLATGVLFGLIPALQASRTDLITTLKESTSRTGSGFRQNKTRSLLVIGEMALALILPGSALRYRFALPSICRRSIPASIRITY